MVKTESKEKRKGKKSTPPMHEYYRKFKTYGIPIAVLIVSYLAFRLRNMTSNYKTFFDPDTFYHYELYRIAINEWIPKYFAYAEPPTGIKPGGYLGLYTIQAAFYKVTHALFGTDVLGAFKLWPPFIGALTVIAIYLLGRKLHSDWAGFWAALFIAFSSANYYKTMSGNNRGEGPFMAFFLLAVFFALLYIEEKKLNWKKVLWGALFLMFSVLYMAAWTGSTFGVSILLAFAGVYPVLLFVFGNIEELKRFVAEFYSLYGISLLLGLFLSGSGFVNIKWFLVFAIEVFAFLVILAGVMLFGEKLRLNYSDKKHRFAVVAVITVLALAVAYLQFGPELVKFMGGAYQSNPLYQTVAELKKTTMADIKASFSIRGNDGMLFVLSLAGFAAVFARFLWKLSKGDVTGYREVFLVTYYGASFYLLLMAVRFTFQASGAVMLLAGVLVGEVFRIVEEMKDTATTKTMYAILLILLFLPLPIASGQYLSRNAKSYSLIGGSVDPDWSEALTWLKKNSDPLDSATSWWDYGYWIESSLLSHRRSSTDGGHAYDRRYLVADFFAHHGNESEVDFEAWELNYMIVWQSDITKFNAISYLGGAITYGEYRDVPVFQTVPKDSIQYSNESGQTVVYILAGQYALQPKMTIDLTTGRVIQGRGDIPYVLYVFSNYGLLAYEKIAFSNFVRLAFHLPFSIEPWDAQKLFANFHPVKTSGSVSIYEFRPFAVYRIDQYSNGSWVPFYSPLGGGKLPVGETKLRLWISAFGRDVENASLIFEAYNGTELIEKKVIAENLNINHLNETPVEVSLFVPNATSYRFILVQRGPVGVLNGPVYVNGKLADPTYVLKEGESGDIKLTAAFRKDYSDVDLVLRASIVYYIAPNGNDIYSDNFYLEPHQDIIAYIPVKEGLSVKQGDNNIAGSASLPDGVFSEYIDKLKQKYGEDKVVVWKLRVEPVFLTQKEYVIWEG
ncbi:MAG: dolichyl-phosphooligosaccharide-protein glycotransferase [Thermococcaceae archaeon]|nr:dolichyl-phosphooligosaccharide-protein glycotransferase [Thermococcaceae archaeon]MDK2913516.1 dolichyl-phosphooligosaccharide-protein glycotransferase [Thermococcaceae archaeon]